MVTYLADEMFIRSCLIMQEMLVWTKHILEIRNVPTGTYHAYLLNGVGGVTSVGTMPSITSHGQSTYYAHARNGLQQHLISGPAQK